MTRYLANIVAGLLFGYYAYFNIGVEVSFIKLVLAASCFASVILYLRRKDIFLKSFLSWIVIIGFSFCFGVGYINVLNQKDNTLNFFSGEVVVKDVEINMEGSKVILYSKEIDKVILFNTFSFQKVNLIPGDKLKVSGKLENEVFLAPERNKNNWESFDYSNYLRASGIDYVIKVDKYEKTVSHETTFNRIGFRLRSFLLQKLNNIMPDQKAGIVMAMVLGDNQGLTKDIKDIFRNSGLSHVLVFSGFNFAILIATFSFLVASLGKKTQIISKGIFAAAIFFIVPFSAPTARAGTFVLYALAANLFNKTYNIKFILWFFILSYTLFNPIGSISSASFHLSILATIGMIYGGEVIQNLTKNTVKRYIYMIFSIFLIIFPYILHVFGGVSLFSMLANAVALPIVSLITVLGICVIVLAVIFPLLGAIFAHLLTVLINFLLGVANIFSPYYINLKSDGLDLSFTVFCYVFLFITYSLFIFKVENKDENEINR